MSTIKTVSKKPFEQNKDDRSDFDLSLINELDLFVSKLTNQGSDHESLQKINEDISKIDSNLEKLEALKSRAESQIKTINDTYSAVLTENELLKHKLGLN